MPANPASPATGFRFLIDKLEAQAISSDDELYVTIRAGRTRQTFEDDEHYYALPLTPEGTVAPEVVERLAEVAGPAMRAICETANACGTVTFADRCAVIRAALSALVQEEK